MNRRDFLHTLLSGAAAAVTAPLAKWLPKVEPVKTAAVQWDDVLDVAVYTDYGQVEMPKQWRSVSWKWYGGYGRWAENMIVRAERE